MLAAIYLQVQGGMSIWDMCVLTVLIYASVCLSVCL